MLGSQQLAFACDELALWLALSIFLKMGVGFFCKQRLLLVDSLGILLSISYSMCRF